MLCDISLGLKIDWFSQRMSIKVKDSLQKKLLEIQIMVKK